MTTEAEVGNALGGQQVAIDRAVGLMAARATFDPGRAVFIQERAAFVGMAFEAGFLLETSEDLRAGLGRVGIMAGNAFQDAFLEAVPLVELEFGHDVLVAGRAGPVRLAGTGRRPRWQAARCGSRGLWPADRYRRQRRRSGPAGAREGSQRP